MSDTQPLKLQVDDTTVAALWMQPARPRATYVFAHGAGAGMNHSFMADLSQALFDQSIATLRYQFPYMERGSRRTDSPAVAHAAVRAAVAVARERLPDTPLFAGGKSFGGRMTSQAQAAAPATTHRCCSRWCRPWWPGSPSASPGQGGRTAS